MEGTHSSGDGGNVKGMENKHCLSTNCFLRHSDRSVHFQAIFAMDLTLHDKAELVLLNMSAICNHFGRLHSEIKRPVPSNVRRLKFNVVELGSVHRRDCSVIRRLATTRGVEVALRNFV